MVYVNIYFRRFHLHAADVDIVHCIQSIAIFAWRDVRSVLAFVSPARGVDAESGQRRPANPRRSPPVWSAMMAKK
jgi:hypothetical protein